MTLKQGDDINKKFNILNDSIKNLKLSQEEYMIRNGQRIQKVYTDWNQELNNHRVARAEADSFKLMYEANKRMYEFREVEFRKERRAQQIFTAAIMVITVAMSIL